MKDGDGGDTIVPSREPILERDGEVDAVVALIRREGVRLVTVVGPSGVGKTTVAEEAARRLAAIDPVTTRRVNLADLSDTTAAAALAAAVTREGLAARTGPAPPGRSHLVLVEGVEALTGAADALADALDADADLSILVTSLNPLQLRGEHLVRLAPFDTSTTDGSPAPALRFFTSRLVAHGGRDDLDETETRCAQELVELVAGLPVALELAAARAAGSSPAAVTEELRSRPALEVLSDDGRGADDRHRSLRATIAWTCGGLCEGDRRLLARLACVPGAAATVDTVAELCGPIGDEDDDTPVVDRVRRLMDAGLVEAPTTDAPAELTEVRMSTPVRHYALDSLATEEERVAVADRHAEHYRTLARTASPLLRSTEGISIRRALREHREDLIAALDHLLERGERVAVTEMVADLQPFWAETGNAAVARRLLAESVDDASSSAELRARAAVCSAEMRLWERRWDEPVDDILAHLEEADRWAEVVGDHRLRLEVADQLVQTLLLAERVDEAQTVATGAHELASSVGHPWWACAFIAWQATTANQLGDSELALKLAVDAREQARRLGDEERVLWASIVLTGIPGALEQLDRGAPVLEDLLDMAVRIGDEAADGLLRIALAVRVVFSGGVGEAVDHLRAALELARQCGYWHLEQLCVLCLIITAILAGRAAEGVRLHGAVEPLLGNLGRVMSPSQLEDYRMAVGLARGSLGDDDYELQVRRGSVMGWRQVLVAADDLMDDLCAVEAPPDGIDEIDLTDDDVADLGGEVVENGLVRLSFPGGDLTVREMEVLRLMASGCSNKEIASELGLRPKTVMHHTSAIYRKLAVRSRTEAAAAAWKTGLVDAPG